VDRVVEHRKERNSLPKLLPVNRTDECRLHQAPGGGKRHHRPVGLHLSLFYEHYAGHHRNETPRAHWDDHVGVDASDFLRALIGATAHPLEVAVQLDADLGCVHGDHAPDF
jgi:hypothetical protein